MTTTDKLHDTLDRAIEDGAEFLTWLRQLKHELPEPAPVDECSVLEAAAEISERHGYYGYEADIRALLIKVRARNMLAGMRDATTARKEGANA